jgi:hypothetical protein
MDCGLKIFSSERGMAKAEKRKTQRDAKKQNKTTAWNEQGASSENENLLRRGFPIQTHRFFLRACTAGSGVALSSGHDLRGDGDHARLRLLRLLREPPVGAHGLGRDTRLCGAITRWLTHTRQCRITEMKKNLTAAWHPRHVKHPSLCFGSLPDGFEWSKRFND